MTLSLVFDYFGFIGGVLFAFGLVPQIYRVHKLKSAEDVSFAWQILFDSGLIMVLLYFVHFGLWAIVPPVVVEIFEVSYLIFLKAYFQRAAASQKGDQADILGKKLLSKDGLSQHNDEEKGGSDPADYSPNFGNGNGNGNGSTF